MKHRSRLICLIVALALVLLALIPCYCWMRLREGFQEQTAAERWRGSNDAHFAQVSCFLDERAGITADQEYAVRQSLEDTLAGETEERWILALSGSCSVTAARNSTQITARGVYTSGSYNHFHPIQMVSGSWFDPKEVNRDGVVLDMQLAWKLFGGYDLQGMSITINGIPVQISGVARVPETAVEQDIYGQTPTLWLSMDLMNRLGMYAAATYVEAVLPNPVENFAVEKLKSVLGSGSTIEIIENTGRFRFLNCLKVFLHPDSRVVRTSSVAYPYWENAARVAESRCGMYAAAIVLLMVFPVTVALYWVSRGLKWMRCQGRALLRKR
ncbi:MAG: ABC transporter permease [Clostridia bacterium]|nr:ABC transporter permease [Clostridia bacterium]